MLNWKKNVGNSEIFAEFWEGERLIAESNAERLTNSNPPTTGILARLSFISVRYHCGGWSEEVNSCILISYMVYL